MRVIDLATKIHHPLVLDHLRPETGRSGFWSCDFSDPISLVEFDADPLWVHPHQPIALLLS